MRSKQVVAAAREAVGAKFCHAGRDPATGVDCAGLVIYALGRAGIAVCQDHGDGRQACWCRRYSRDIPTEQLRAALEKHLVSVGVQERRPGDVLLFRAQGVPRHLAIMSGLAPPMFIHGREGEGGQVMEEEFGKAQRLALVAVYRVPEEAQ